MAGAGERREVEAAAAAPGAQGWVGKRAPLLGGLAVSLVTIVAAFGAEHLGLEHLGLDPDVPPWPGGMNVVLISIDTVRRDHLSFYGYERQTSPNLSDLAERSVVFDQAIAVHTNTAPSHASMLTGRYPARHGIVQNGMRLRPDVPTLQGVLGEQGYATGAFVSGWTLTDHVGLDAGFDVYDATLPGDGERLAQDTIDAALPWVQERASRGERFFLFLHHFDPHFPYDPPADCVGRFLPDGSRGLQTTLDRRLPREKARSGLDDASAAEYVSRYDGEIFYADRHVGRFLDGLRRLGLREHTLVVFVSDHGESLWERDWVFDHGGRAYDEQIRVPLVLAFPDGRGAGERRRGQVSHVDLMPTVLEWLEVAAPPDLDGRSLLPVVQQETPADLARPAFAHGRPEPSRVPEITAPLRREGLVSVVRYPDHKLIEYPGVRDPYVQQLFDLVRDPGERTNLVPAQWQLAARLHEQLEDFRRGTQADQVGAPPALPPEIEAGLRALGYLE